MTLICQNFRVKKSLKISYVLVKMVNFGNFVIEKKKVKKTTFFWRPPINETFCEKSLKLAFLPYTVQKKGQKIKESWVYTFTFFPKMAVFENLPILTNAKKRKKWTGLIETKILVPEKQKSWILLYTKIYQEFIR